MFRAACLASIALVLCAGSQRVDASLLVSSIYTGNVDATMAAYATSGGPGAGTLTVSGIPVSATILQATLYGNNYFSSPSMSANFDGNPLGPVGAFATNGGFRAYKADVTSFVTGNGSYSASYSGPTNTYGLALVVVYADASLPSTRVEIADGAIDLIGGPYSIANFSGAGAGAGRVFLHTAADNGLGQSNELIQLNGNTIGGPIDNNLGPFASLFSLPVTTLAGANALDIFDPAADQFGVDVAVLVSPIAGEAAVPEPSTLMLLGSASLGWMTFRQLRRRQSK
jgi:hypothetical protein